MQRLLIFAVAILVVAVPAAAEARLAFRTPGSFAAAETSAKDLSWAVLVFENVPASFSFTFASGGQVENRTLVYPVSVYNHSQEATPYGRQVQEFRDVPAGAKFTVSSPVVGKVSIYIEADHIRFATNATAGKLAEKPDGMGINPFMRQQDKEGRTYQQSQIPGDYAVLQHEPHGAASFALAADGVRHLEWHGAQVQCEGTDWCPDGGTTRATKISLPVTDFNVSSEQFSYEIATGGLGPVKGEGSFVYAILGGRQLGFSLENGRLRLPLASLEGTCEGCILPDNQTLTAGGDLALLAMQRAGDGKLEASLGGSITEARFDEQIVDPRTLLGSNLAVGAVAVAAVGTVVLWKLLAFFALRDPLANPTRRRVLDAVIAQPGATYRDLMETTGLGDGTVRHHLRVLHGAGLIAIHQHGRAVRHFENHGRYDTTWRSVAALRDPGLRELYEWLAVNPGARLQAVQDALPWSRWTLRKRLRRLMAWGLVAVEESGAYSARFVPEPPAGPGS